MPNYLLINMAEVGLFEPYADMLLLDGLISNPDRHEFNFGVIKSTATGEILGLAPNFDHNLALGSTSGLSTYLLEWYLSEVGIQEHQVSYVIDLNIELIKYIDNRIKKEIGADGTDTTDIIQYFIEVIRIIKQYV